MQTAQQYLAGSYLFKVINRNTRTILNSFFWCFYYQIGIDVTQVSIAAFEEVNIGCLNTSDQMKVNLKGTELLSDNCLDSWN